MEGKIVGVDIAKGWLDICLAGEGKVERAANTAEAIGCWLDRVKPGLVAFEPTGGYERDLCKALRERGILYVRIHPNDVIAFRKSRGVRAKTDAIDARLIAAFASEELSRRGLRPSLERDEELRELAVRRRQLVDALQAERCRHDLACSPAVRRSLALVIDTLREQLDVIEVELQHCIARNAKMAELAGLLQTIHGIGPIVAMSLIADLPELGHLSGKEIAALVGLAPNTRESGKTRQRAVTGHGRPGARRALFNAARASIRHPSPFKSFYDRLRIENHRPGKVALTAVMRKLLVTANAVARERQPWKLA
jgi:transposase